jgi:hypothetical protein
MGGRNIDEHLYPAVHYNGFRASPIFVAIGAIGGRRIYFNFIDYIFKVLTVVK